jgi:hypothetical protein
MVRLPPFAMITLGEEAIAATRPGGVTDPASLDGELDLVGVEEVAEFVQVLKTGLHEFSSSPRFPQPLAEVTMNSLYKSELIRGPEQLR